MICNWLQNQGSDSVNSIRNLFSGDLIALDPTTWHVSEKHMEDWEQSYQLKKE